MPISLGQLALFVGATCSGLVGLYFIWYLPRRPHDFGVGNHHKWGDHYSLPTRLLAGFAALVLGYHLAIWAFPPSLTNLQVPRDRWWLLLLAAAGAVLASVALDRLSTQSRDSADQGGSSAG